MAIYASDCFESGVEMDNMVKDCDLGETLYSIPGEGVIDVRSWAFDQLIRRE